MKGSENGGGRSELRPHLEPDCGILRGSVHVGASSTAGSQLCGLTPFIEDFQFSVFRFHNLLPPRAFNPSLGMVQSNSGLDNGTTFCYGGASFELPFCYAMAWMLYYMRIMSDPQA